ncbi:MAG TPA: glycoside hydrolase family 36 protein [Streptosporangiaceae bacterium]|nr:glycoside hydrolase family 36 protein [Streptosporangiaceae bacterium]
MAGTEQLPRVIGWADENLELRIEVDRDGMARLTRLSAPGGSALARDAALPLLDVIVTGEGRGWSGGRYCESEAGARFRYAGHVEGAADGPWRELRVDLDDPVTGLRAEVFYRVLDSSGPGAGGAGGAGLRSWVRLENRGARPVTVESVTSFLYGGLGTGPGPDDLADLDVLWAEYDWMAEGRWQARPLRDALPDISRLALGADPRGCFSLTSAGSWSSGRYLPAGAIVNRRSGHAWAWQIEHNGGWHWQAGECTHRSAAAGPGPRGRHAPAGTAGGAYLALLGPTDAGHHWRVTLDPGEAFTTVPASVAVSPEGFDGAVAGLTAVRRAIRRPHEDGRRLPVIFNDYMNTVMGNPTTERLLPLIAAAAEAGAEYFCVDSGWYAEIDEGWWDTVGAWRPSQTRFPGGIAEVLDRIRDAGMVPGLWLEPEVVGVNSEVVRQLPADAFFQRGGQLIVEHGRYHLDLRHPAAVKHLDQVVDFLVGELGVGYLKLDYNIEVGPGPDTGGVSAGVGLLAANRAELDWLDAVLDRHPGLVIENCSSGGMRTDYALLSRMQLQSTSDQQDFLRYPPIAAAAPAAIAPEQAAVWAYPQPEFTDDEIAFTMASAMLGRVHLSGHLDRMSRRQRDLVADAVRVYKESVRSAIAGSTPFWPLGLPRWEAPWIALGLRAPGVSHLAVWRREPRPGTDADHQITVALPHLHGARVTARVLYPPHAAAEASWNASLGALTVTLPRSPSACVVRLEVS